MSDMAVYDARDQRIDELKQELAEVRQLLDIARAERDRAQREGYKAMAELRKVLTPLHRALKMIFGELDAAGVEEPITGTGETRISPIWASWKAKMPGRPAQFIDILLEHGEMNIPQLKVAAKCGDNTAYQTISKLHSVGLINKAGGRYSLKQP